MQPMAFLLVFLLITTISSPSGSSPSPPPPLPSSSSSPPPPPPLPSSSSSSPPPPQPVRRPHQHFVAPLIHITSPEHPLYNPNTTFEEYLTQSINVSNARHDFFLNIQQDPSVGAFAPISLSFLMKYQLGKEKVDSFGVPDTGSVLFWLQCEPCKSCHKQRLPRTYNFKTSTGFEPLYCHGLTCKSLRPSVTTFCSQEADENDGGCRYSTRYADTTSSYGILGTDVLTLWNGDGLMEREVEFEELVFGCGTNNTDPHSLLHPGVVGLGHTHPASILTQMNFMTLSYCVSTDYPNRHGYIRFGANANAPAPLIGGTNTTSLTLGRSGHYYLRLVGMVIGDKYINLKRFFEIPNPSSKEMKGMIIDSGTPLTRLQTEAFDIVLEELKTHVSGEVAQTRLLEFCVSDTDYAKMPAITFAFVDGYLPVEKENIWFPVHDTWHGMHNCLGILRSTSRVSILGMYTGRNLEIGYDLENYLLWWQSNPNCPVTN